MGWNLGENGRSESEAVRYGRSAFGATRVVEPFTLADIINRYDIDPRVWGTDSSGSGAVSHNANLASIDLDVTTASGDESLLQTHRSWRYQAGKGQRIIQTVFFATATGRALPANQRGRWGFMNTTDGIFWQATSAGLSLFVRSTVTGATVETEYAESEFNGDYRPTDIDLSKGNIFEFDFQWLGYGVIRAYINGRLVHTISNPNQIAGPYMRSARLPLRYELTNTGTSTANTLHATCASVLSEGGDPPPEYGYCLSVEATGVGTTETALLAIRPKSTLNSINVTGDIFPSALEISADADITFRVYMDPDTISGGSFVSHSDESMVERNTTITGFTVGAGEVVGLYFQSSGSGRTESLESVFKTNARLLENLFPSGQDELLVTAQKRTGGTTDARVALVWREVR